jgi:hypothetical protein
MGQITAVSGTVSGVRLDSSVSVTTTVSVPQSEYGTATASTSTVKTDLMNFRVDNRPVYMPVAINITNGDVVTAAGFQKGEFEALSVFNHTTKTSYWVPEPSTVPEIIYMVVGVIVLMFHISGWLVIGGAVLFMMNKNKKIKQIRDARAMAKDAQPSVGKAA